MCRSKTGFRVLKLLISLALILAPLQNERPLPVAPVSVNHDQLMRGKFPEGFVHHLSLPNEGERYIEAVAINGFSSMGGPPGSAPASAGDYYSR